MDANSKRFTRRAALALAAGFFVTTVSAVLAQGAPIRAIKVSGRANRDLARIAPMVARELAHQLGSRYVPGARGGATLAVELTVLDLPVDTGSDGFFMSFGEVDVLKGQIALVGAGGAALQQFPLLAQTGSTDASDMYPDATDARLGSLAYTYAHWVVSKLN
jgi:hypothetical protein